MDYHTFFNIKKVCLTLVVELSTIAKIVTENTRYVTRLMPCESTVVSLRDANPILKILPIFYCLNSNFLTSHSTPIRIFRTLVTSMRHPRRRQNRLGFICLNSMCALIEVFNFRQVFRWIYAIQTLTTRTILSNRTTLTKELMFVNCDGFFFFKLC